MVERFMQKDMPGDNAVLVWRHNMVRVQPQLLVGEDCDEACRK